MNTEYITRVLTPTLLRDSLDQAEAKLANVRFDAIAAAGNSGTLFAGALSARLQKPVVLVRKAQDGSHSGYRVNGIFPNDQPFSYIIVDDFIDTGKTVKHIKDSIHEINPTAQYVGVYLYNSDSFQGVI